MVNNPKSPFHGAGKPIFPEKYMPSLSKNYRFWYADESYTVVTAVSLEEAVEKLDDDCRNYESWETFR